MDDIFRMDISIFIFITYNILMATNKHRKKKLKKNVTHTHTHTHKHSIRKRRHYRKRLFKNSLREYLVSENRDMENEKHGNMKNDAVEKGNMVYGLRDMLSHNKNQ